MSIRPRSGNWHYRFEIAGHEWSGDTGLAATERNRDKALRVEAEARRLISAGRPQELKLQPRPFSEAAKSYATWCDGEYREHPASARRIQVSLTSLKAHFGGVPVSGITAGSIEDYKAARRSIGVKEITLRHDLHALSGLFQYAMKHGWAARNIVRDVEIPSDAGAVRMHVLSSNEEARYFQACTEVWKVKDKTGVEHTHGPFPDLRDLALLVLETGMRPDDEALSLAWSAIDWVKGSATVVRGKTAAAKRTLRLTAAARVILEARFSSDAGKGQWVFPGRCGGHIVKLNASHDLVCAHAGLEFVLYDLRHTFATRMAALGCPLPTLARILGHASLRTIQRYVHIGQADMDAAMEKYAPSGFRPATASKLVNFGESTGKAN
ncbi:MAG TPA: site-specific integrase [Bryobacteraceae bacterium]|nr:site-specific integrase [Bryobacteraceae bacterium]